MPDVDVAIVGAGVVGLACAAALAARGRSVAVLERNRGIGHETTSRNSGVVHAGLYYPTGSLKARLCVAGRLLLYERCARLGVPHRRCGKIIVATSEAERATLAAIHAQAVTNDAGDVRLLDGDEVTRLEPRVRAVAGLLSPETGIVDAHALAESFRREAEEHGAIVALDNTVTGLERAADGWRVRAVTSAGSASEVAARFVVNAAGLGASRIAALAGFDVAARGWEQRLVKGDYFRLAARHRGMAARLVYPVPIPGGLGVHITFDLTGELRGGPDVELVTEERYDVDPAKAAAFGASLRRYLPDVRDADLSPDYAGIRPRLGAPGDPFRDFVIDLDDDMVNLVGIESPGLTASAAIGLEVAKRLA